MTSRDYAILDVFTDTPLEGNPLAVFPDALDLDAGLMQRVARELNLSETVFLGPLKRAPGPGEPHAELRIFTPTTEMPFAGHPTLGSAFLVRELLGAGDVTLRLRPPAGEVPVSFAGEEGEMVQPLPEPVELADGDAEAALGALGIESAVLGPAAYCNGPVHAFVEVGTLSELSALAPDLGRLGALGALGFTVYASAGAPGHYRSRMFAPGLGVAEDPATGSAAGPLAAHLVRHGREAPGTQIRIEQGVEMGRRSLLLACAEGTAESISRVRVAGRAVVVARGSFRLD